MNIEEAKKKYKVVIEYVHWYDRLFGAYYILFKGWVCSNGNITVSFKEETEPYEA